MHLAALRFLSNKGHMAVYRSISSLATLCCPRLCFAAAIAFSACTQLHCNFSAFETNFALPKYPSICPPTAHLCFLA